MDAGFSARSRRRPRLGIFGLQANRITVRIRANVVRSVSSVINKLGRRAGSRSAAILLRLLSLPLVPADVRHLAPRRAVQFFLSCGGEKFALGFVARLGQSDDAAHKRVTHDLYVDLGDIEAASVLAATSGPSAWTDQELQILLRADRQHASGHPQAALTTLAAASVQTTDHTRGRLRSLRAEADLRSIADILGGRHGLLPHELAIEGFDLEWQRGNLDAARAYLAGVTDAKLRDIGIVRRIRTLNRWDGIPDATSVDQILTPNGRLEDPDWASAVLFEFDRLDSVLELGIRHHDRLGPAGRFNLARTHYVQRDFSATREILPSLLGTHKHWDSEKLESRMLLEEGNPVAALANRRQRGRLRRAFDEVEYFSLLHLGRFDEGFAQFLHVTDRLRLQAEFGHRACILDRSPGTADKFVIPQNGPGDEILMAATYARLQQSGSTLAAACDPRLLSLFRRSFPAVEFVPAERFTERQPGFLAEGRQHREANSFFDLLNEHAARVASRCDEVILGRSLIRLISDDGPYDPYLIADSHNQPIPTSGRRRVGIVWRSEFMDAMRSIHYLRPSALAPLAALDCSFVNLQHDATADEREVLTRIFGSSIEFIDHVDLRDDFESTAGALTALDAVVGVGTTILELAAALGRPAITLYPNCMGAWRGIGSDRHDRWHRTMRVAVASEPSNPDGCVDIAADLLRQEFGRRAS